MDIKKCTIIQQTGNKSNYIYPKTTADMVEYGNSNINDAVDDINDQINDQSNKISQIDSTLINKIDGNINKVWKTDNNGNPAWRDDSNDKYTIAELMGLSSIGSNTQPVYWDGKSWKATEYTLGKSVPSDAKFTDTTYTNGEGLALSGNTFSNSGVRSISSGSTNGTISVNTNGTNNEVAVKGLGSAAYTASSNYASASHSHTKSNISDLNKQVSKEDLNDIKSVGFYYAGGGNTVTNKPSGVDAFGLEVIQSAGGWTTQILYASNNVQKSYRRWFTGSTWGSWTEDKLTDTWRGIQNNLTSTSTTDSLSAAQGKVLNDKIGPLSSLSTNNKTNIVEAINEAMTQSQYTFTLSGTTLNITTK